MKKQFLFLLLAMVLPFAALAQKEYYASIDGKQGGATLKTALYNLVKDHKQIPYGSGSSSTWGAFYTTDAIEENGKKRVADMYSPTKRYFGSKGESVSGMNIEHSVAKSWWGGGKNNAYCDLHHLNPSDQTANSRKSNYPLAELNSVTWNNGVTFVGKATINGSSMNAFEPADEYKGDFARTYMYMFTCYQDLKWEYTWMNYENSEYPTLKPWAVTLLLKWHRQDPVSEKEVRRNNAVYEIQGNRNPYVDYPQLADYVWGDSIDYVFHLSGDVEDGSGSGNSGDGGGNGDVDGGDGNEGGDSGNGEEPPTGDGNLNTTNFELITDDALLSVGDSIVIVYDNLAISTEQRSNNRGVADVIINNNKISYMADDVQVLVLHQGSISGTFALYTGTGYLYAGSSSSNYLRTQSTVDGNASWLITIASDGTATIIAQGDKTRNNLRYNNSANLFSCYSSGQKAVSIYGKSPEKTSVDSVVTDASTVEIYTVNGILIARATSLNEALNVLPKGVYVISNKKYVVR